MFKGLHQGTEHAEGSNCAGETGNGGGVAEVARAIVVLRKNWEMGDFVQ